MPYMTGAKSEAAIPARPVDGQGLQNVQTKAWTPLLSPVYSRSPV